MDVIDHYLTKNKFIPEIQEKPSEKLGIIIVIPCFNEPGLLDTLTALHKCTLPECDTEIITVINHNENATENIVKHNEKTLRESLNWITENKSPHLTYHIIYKPDLPQKHAGVGLARKTGMDEALYRFNLIKNHNGIIAGFDADAVCDTNYLTALWDHFKNNPKTPGASIYFEHPVDSEYFPAKINNGIVLYELHLRYLNQAMRFTGHPCAYHTVGSSFAVRANAYAKQGGMNKRKAGEDFYFIQKIISLGNYSEINTTRIVPSPRESDRVPFGTGAAITKWAKTDNEAYLTYNWASFETLQSFFQLISNFYTSHPSKYSQIIDTLHPSIIAYLEEINYLLEIQQVKNNTQTIQSFINRFYNWFSVFKAIKYLNASNIGYYNMGNVIEESKLLLHKKYNLETSHLTKTGLLQIYRNLDRGHQ
jgi:hypothetical protein